MTISSRWGRQTVIMYVRGVRGDNWYFPADASGEQWLYAVFNTESQAKSLFAPGIGWKWLIKNMVYTLTFFSFEIWTWIITSVDSRFFLTSPSFPSFLFCFMRFCWQKSSSRFAQSALKPLFICKKKDAWVIMSQFCKLSRAN